MKPLLRAVPALALVCALFGIGAVNAARPHPPRLSPPTTLRAIYGLESPRKLVPARTAVLLVDFQREFFDGRLPLPGAPPALAHAARLAAWAREHGVRLVFVRQVAATRQSPLFAPDSPGIAFLPALEPRPGELVVTKSRLGAFTGTDLHERLQTQGIDTLIVAGLMTHLAVQVSVLDAAALGYRTIVASDAVATRSLPSASGAGRVDESELQRATLAGLGDRAADVLDVTHITRLELVP